MSNDVERPTASGKDAADKVLVVVLSGVTSSVLGAWLFGDSLWVVLPSMVLAAVIVLTLPTRLLSREGYGTSLLARLMAYALLVGYIVASVIGSYRWSTPILIVAVSCLTCATATLLWPGLRKQVGWLGAFLGVASMLVSVALLVYGVAQVLLGGSMLFGGVALLQAVGALLFGVAVLRGSFNVKWVGVLLLGVGTLVLAVMALWDGPTLAGAAMLLAAVAVLLAGVSVLRKDSRLFGGGMLLGGVGMLLLGIEMLKVDPTFVAMASVLVGYALLFRGAGNLWKYPSFSGLGTVLLGMAALLVAIWQLRDGTMLLGVAMLMFLTAYTLIFSVSALRKLPWRRIWRELSRPRRNPPSI